MVRCKFKVVEKTEYVNYDPSNDAPFKITLNAENCEPFGKFTPTGTIEMVIKNNKASEQLKVGQYYFVDFTPVE